MLRRRLLIALGSGFAVIVLNAPAFAFAASLSFSPAAQTVAVGEIFTVTVNVSSPDEAINAASGDIAFPSDKLRAIAILKANSIMSLWVQNPSFSNAVGGGDVSFAGISLNPGFTGSDGNVIIVRFQAVAPGDAPISFSSGAVLANDGSGTNVLDALGMGDVTVVPAPAAPPGAPSSVSQTSSSAAAPTSSEAAPPAGSVTGTTTTVATPPAIPPVTTNYLVWYLVTALVFLLIALIAVLIYYFIKQMRPSHALLVRSREELRDDLIRIERELEAGKSGSKIDLSPGGLRKKHDQIHREIEHLEEDIRKDVRDL